MDFDLNQLAPGDRFKLLISVVVPRPIAFTTTLDAEGRINAAPFSFFNLMGNDPPIVVLAPGDRPDGAPKDTALNIRATQAFVVNIVDEALAEAMNIAATAFPPGTNELGEAGLTTLPSVQVAVPRIAEAPVSLECREVMTLQLGRTRIVLGEVLHLHLRDDLLDLERMRVHTDRLRAVGRMHGGGWYTRTTDLFQLPRLSVEAWREKRETKGGSDY
ncbi:MAG: flavin reductase family protein [Bacteroidetes bacterium]|nr:flavin reductase family protein [Bacteroidota bacterium]